MFLIIDIFTLYIIIDIIHNGFISSQIKLNIYKYVTKYNRYKGQTLLQGNLFYQIILKIARFLF